MKKIFNRKSIIAILIFVITVPSAFLIFLSMILGTFKGYGKFNVVGLANETIAIFMNLSVSTVLSLAIGVFYLVALIAVVRKFIWVFPVIRDYIGAIKNNDKQGIDDNYSDLIYLFNYSFKWFIAYIVVSSLGTARDFTALGATTAIICIIVFALGRILGRIEGDNLPSFVNIGVESVRSIVASFIMAFALKTVIEGHWLLFFTYSFSVDSDESVNIWASRVVVIEMLYYIAFAFVILSLCRKMIDYLSDNKKDSYMDGPCSYFKVMGVYAIICSLIKFVLLYFFGGEDLHIRVQNIIYVYFQYNRNDLLPIALFAFGGYWLFRTSFGKPVKRGIVEIANEKSKETEEA